MLDFFCLKGNGVDQCSSRIDTQCLFHNINMAGIEAKRTIYRRRNFIDHLFHHFFSSMPFIPILMSRMAAPFSSCAIAISRTRSSFPSRSWACSFFFPVGLIRSPTTRKLPSRPTSTFCAQTQESCDAMQAACEVPSPALHPKVP